MDIDDYYIRQIDRFLQQIEEIDTQIRCIENISYILSIQIGIIDKY